ncbi:MAG: class A beta-lactamase-related serine hydrolase [Phenylobacterium sp.]|nr:MAG: class A beta-lactamase-related serine hydrolase [Phenylobacterium sp.]
MAGEDAVAAAIGEAVGSGQLAGAVSLLWRDGRVVQTAAVGWRDREADLPMTRDTIFRIASMSKPVTSVAALSLMEAGGFALDDPIARWAPEFHEMRVLRSPTGPLHDGDPAERPITFEDLLTHRSGITYGDFWQGPIAAAYADLLGGSIDSRVEPDDWIPRLAGLPLIDQPGRGFHYGASTDLLGLLIARIEGAPLGEVLQKRVFGPLGMRDTGFAVPPEARERRAAAYGFDAGGRLARLKRGVGDAFQEERPDWMSFVSGGQGLWSTVDDYLAFARLFLGEGAVDGVRVLQPETMRLMTTNRLTEAQRAAAALLNQPVFASGNGFGLGVAVVLDPATALVMRGKGGLGTVGWPGAFGGWWQADPTDGSVAIFLMHNMVGLEQIAKGLGMAGYMALLEFQALATARG